MATAEELLSGTTSSSDKTLIISNDLRTISIPSTVTCLGVEYDDDVLRLKFKMPRYLGNTDLSVFSIRVNYLNSKGESDVYSVSNAIIGGSFITFDWLVGPTATRYKGNTKFNVCLKTFTSDGYIDREFNTTIATLPVLEGLEVDEGIVAMYTDILEQWRRELFGAGDTIEASIRAVSQEEQEKVAQKGVEVLASIPEDYQTSFKIATDAYRTKAEAIVCSAKGEVISISDSANEYLRGLKIFGKTTQVATTGKQLAQSTTGIQKSNGITFTPNSDGSITIAGTSSTGEAYYIFDNYNVIPQNIKNVELTVSISGSDKVSVVVGYYTTGDSFVNDIATINSANPKTFTYPEEATATRTFLAISKGITVNATVYPLIRRADITDSTYESYSGGVTSPCPDYPQELKSLGEETGEIKTEIYGKNLLGQNGNYTSTYSSYVLNAVIDNGVVSLSGASMLGYGTIQVSLPLGAFKKGKTYRISRVSNNFHIGFWFYDEYNTNIGSLTTENSLPITIPENADHMSLFYAGLTPETNVNLTEKFMLNLGTEALPWEPYVDSQSIVNTCPNELPGIPVSQNGNHTDANGQQWICDEIDFERGVYVQRIATKTLDGSNILPYYAMHSNGQSYVALYPSDIKYGSPVMSNRYAFSAINWSDLNNTVYGIGGAIIINDNRFTDGDVAATAFATELPEIMYVLATPIETALTAEEIEAFKYLSANFPTTTVINDADAEMELKYNADTKTYLDNLPKATDAQVQAAVDAWLTAKYGSIAEEASF